MEIEWVLENPTETIRRIFQGIADTRMLDFPLSNTALKVEAVGFQEWNGLWVGVLITPWSMLLLVQPKSNTDFRVLPLGPTQTWAFPSGPYDFFGLNEPGLGPTHMCSLFSPAFEFEDHEGAVMTAEEVMKALFTPPTEVEVEEQLVEQAETAKLEGKPISEQPMSRRAFLRGGR